MPNVLDNTVLKRPRVSGGSDAAIHNHSLIEDRPNSCLERDSMAAHSRRGVQAAIMNRVSVAGSCESACIVTSSRNAEERYCWDGSTCRAACVA